MKVKLTSGESILLKGDVGVMLLMSLAALAPPVSVSVWAQDVRGRGLTSMWEVQCLQHQPRAVAFSSKVPSTPWHGPASWLSQGSRRACNVDDTQLLRAKGSEVLVFQVLCLVAVGQGLQRGFWGTPWVIHCLHVQDIGSPL